MNEMLCLMLYMFDVDCYILFGRCGVCMFDRKFTFYLNFYMIAYDHISFPVLISIHMLRVN